MSLESYYNDSHFKLLKYIGDISQIAGMKSYQITNGRGSGIKAVDFWNETGLNFTVLLDRSMDISHTSFKGSSLCWRSPVGEIHPHYFEPQGIGWVRGFFGGLLTTCGLTYLGSPCVDQGEALGLHGRISYIPAEDVQIQRCWKGSDYEMSISGSMRQVSVFGENLLLRRTITTWLAKSEILLEDIVTNQSYNETPFMILYHINIGFPLLSPGSRFISTSEKIAPKDDRAADGVEDFDKYGSPAPGYLEKVYYHEMKADENDMVKCAIISDSSKQEPYGLSISYSKRDLPQFVQWKMAGEQYYVLGVEPSNCWTEGRDKEREWGTLHFLKPKEEKRVTIRFKILEGKEEIKELTESIQKEVGEKPPQIISRQDMIKLKQ